MCQYLFDHWDSIPQLDSEKVEDGVDHGDVSSIKASAKEGCMLCTIYFHQIQNNLMDTAVEGDGMTSCDSEAPLLTK